MCYLQRTVKSNNNSADDIFRRDRLNGASGSGWLELMEDTRIASVGDAAESEFMAKRDDENNA